ncbi:MAG: CoA-binding protein [Chloroflexota bacterium]
MRNRSATRAEIDEFYAQKRLAVVGVSRDEKDWSRLVFRELRKLGYDAVPVNPAASELDGVRCYAKLADVAPAVDGALVLLPDAAAEAAAREAVQAGIKRLWLRNDVPAAHDLCQKADTALIAGYCPFMFMPGAPFFHQFHAFGLKLIGKYPH